MPPEPGEGKPLPEPLRLNALHGETTGHEPAAPARVSLGREAALALALFGLAFTAYFSPVLAAGRLLAPEDALLFHLPAWLAGPTLWTPYVFSGFPALGDPQEMAWYPLALLLREIPGSWNALVVTGYVLAGASAYGFARVAGGSRLAGAVAGTTYGASGFLIAHLQHANMVHAAAWLPLVLLALERLRAGPGGARWTGALALAVAGLALAGHPQVLVYALGLAAGYAIAAAWSAPAGRARTLARALAGTLLGLGAAAVLLLPMRELAGESARAEMSLEEFSSLSLPLRQLPTLLVPLIHGGSGPAYRGAWLFHEMAIYAGLLPLALAATALALGGRGRIPRFFAAAGALSLLLALGDATPIAALVHGLPGYGLFRAPARHAMELSIALAALAAIGVDALARARPEVRGPAIRRASLGLLFALLTAFAAAGAGGARSLVPSLSSLLLPFAALAAGLGALAAFGARPESPARGAALVLAIALDLAAFGWACDWRRNPIHHSALEPPPALASLAARLDPAEGRLATLDGPLQPLEAAPPNHCRLLRIPNASGYNPLVLRRMKELAGMDRAVPGALSYALLEERDRALDLLAVRLLLVPTAKLADAGVSARFLRAESFGETTVLENRRALPRARLVPRALAVTAEEALAAIRTSRLPDGSPYDPTTLALVEEGGAAFTAPARDPAARARLRDLSDTLVVVDTESREPAFLVLADAHYPGWEATIDGTPAPLVRADHALRGLALSAGRHEVRFAFRPWSFRIGAGISAVSVLVALALLARRGGAAS